MDKYAICKMKDPIPSFEDEQGECPYRQKSRVP
jgi:hypothetical protein